jgi:hypothetical protein
VVKKGMLAHELCGRWPRGSGTVTLMCTLILTLFC